MIQLSQRRVSRSEPEGKRNEVERAAFLDQRNFIAQLIFVSPFRYRLRALAYVRTNKKQTKYIFRKTTSLASVFHGLFKSKLQEFLAPARCREKVNVFKFKCELLSLIALG